MRISDEITFLLMTLTGQRKDWGFVRQRHKLGEIHLREAPLFQGLGYVDNYNK